MDTRRYGAEMSFIYAIGLTSKLIFIISVLKNKIFFLKVGPLFFDSAKYIYFYLVSYILIMSSEDELSDTSETFEPANKRSKKQIR